MSSVNQVECKETMMSDPTKPNMDLLNAIFGIESQEDWDDDLSNTHRARRQGQPPVDEAAEARVTEFEQEVAAADAAAIENDTTVMGWKGRLNIGQFGSRAAEMFNWPVAMDVRDAVRCGADAARQNTPAYQALQRIRQERPALYAIIIARIAWARIAQPEDRGPFGNDWDE